MNRESNRASKAGIAKACWGEARNVQDRSLQGARQEYGRGGAEAGAGEEQREGETMMMTTMTTKMMMMKTIITKREK